ncbi:MULTISPECIES: hypothetical protein [Paraburkholderia]|uniref:Uncharacterized protein n=1 Tax=Paraburkholderia metrosideri TaxID=580937 RepID=A0ABW9E6D4_9BURK
MAYNRRHARGLLGASELPLFESSVGEALTGWSAAQLRQKIKRACELRDKYRDLLRRQKLATRERTGTKSGVQGNDNARTEQKVKLFEEVQARLEGRQVKLAAAEARKASQAEGALALAVTRKPRAEPSKVIPAKRLSNKRTAVASATRTPKASVGLTGEKASAAAQRSQLVGSRSKVIQTHIASQGRRQQAVRDKR